MALSNVGSLVLNLLIFITTLVNFSYALTTLEPLMLLGLYAISKIFVTAPEVGIFSKYHLETVMTFMDGINTEAGLTLAVSNRADAENGPKAQNIGQVGLWERIGCFTWTRPTMRMATQGIANVLHGIPFKSEWPRAIGVIILSIQPRLLSRELPLNHPEISTQYWFFQRRCQKPFKFINHSRLGGLV
ncbi:hypothetical protein LZ554_001201 [Drepanopeziza brunnea f. sp. 'monogermtubi']|nr:hypothetical protein LZ554_001201 [Drepanopeziza brunnea f. sp. 'monogermtubi']